SSRPTGRVRRRKRWGALHFQRPRRRRPDRGGRASPGRRRAPLARLDRRETVGASRPPAMNSDAAGPRPVFGVIGAAAVMVGMVVGVGIFTFPSMVAARAPGEWTFLGFWLAGGFVAFIGALCYSELSARHPDAGGEYHFLTRAYGGRVGFLFAW